ncbi:hypothetical protein CLG96_01465 [Sphingomonas oleivorans]|uniref:Dextranase n=1 Tax=Sphingomonas oleivorans TaxID=1735121 RepID=A0A2T5G117_9SPHN|nr:glycoside hydrolase family 66 protein [Sphingomonas oleivorans]PTQ12844.1 hypothetical protein CLG96_01465 [Sphingomonas oleivorans]
MSFLVALAAAVLAPASPATLADAYPDKARYSPGEPVRLIAEIGGKAVGGETVMASVMDLGREVGRCGPATLGENATEILLSCSVPRDDFQGYFVSIRLRSRDGRDLGERTSALDISSDWKRFPRYGYLSHFSRADGADPAKWVRELNCFHINGLQFYDFQYRHEQPLAGTVERPAASWKDIAGRGIEADIVRAFIDEAHRRNMMAMAYNASYSAYADAFSKADPLPIQWATWPSAEGQRTAETAKSFDLNIPGWSTPRLFYMNQNDPAWQDYIFGRMEDLFRVYPFDGWHVDTFGASGGYAYDRSPVDYIAGFRPYIDRARSRLGRRILFNAVNARGQEHIATSAADFVYSELWEDHPTFASILAAAEQVRIANPQKAYVLAAYLHRREAKDGPAPAATRFNLPSVLLTDAAIFASGASHIELGDGERMLSSEYFPNRRLEMSAELRNALRHYYDFLTAYQTYLRGGLEPIDVRLRVEGQMTSTTGEPNRLWTIARRGGGRTMVHLINLLGSDDPRWRDIAMNRPDAPHLRNLRLTLHMPGDIRAAGWASPDVDGGRYQPLAFRKRASSAGVEVEIMLPALHYWSTIILS